MAVPLLPEDFNVFVGAKTGILKGLCLYSGPEGSLVQNVPKDLRVLSKEKEITAMAWADPEESQVLTGHADGTVQIYSPAKGRLKTVDEACSEGPIIGLAKCGNNYVTGIASGTVRLWGDAGCEVGSGGVLERLRVNGDIIATGGPKNDLKLWSISAGLKSTFKAKNVAHNWLELEVPVWISDIAFIPLSEKIIVSTRHGNVRIYDPKAQRRPVFNMEFPEKALTAIAFGPSENHAVVGTGTGQLYKVDFRHKGLIAGHYKGAKGSIREIVCANDHVFSVSLDRHFRVHNGTSRQLIKSEYLKSKLSSLLVKADFEFNKKVEEPEVADDNIEEVGFEETEMDEIFSKMESAEQVEITKSKKSKIIITDIDTPKKKKIKV
ncbi:WD repeat-containing protein 74 [Neocloeon triangulifer]|uniref:WD repeat-containing protein 74 n=1 Tax=Neocloeon triangulifer TaxID=2078957 RepID=UPI00286EFB45|nr:WD repeat-containing protein 74 [Neocloeon triangulifer]